MKIPVVWLSYAPDTLVRGYWDNAMIEDLFSGALWKVPGGFEFEHYDQGVWPDGDVAVVVIPGRHNAHFIDRINNAVVRYKAVLFVITGDEEAVFPWWLLNHSNRRVWAMGARPDRHEGVDLPLGSGYSPGFPAMLTAQDDVSPVRHLDVFFCGQDTHQRRHDAIAASQAIPDNRRHIVATQEFLADGSPSKGGLVRLQYAWQMQRTKLALAPSGPASPDSFRLYEALEAGAIPIADGATPAGPVPGYWEFVFGEDVPFVSVLDWATALPDYVEHELPRWAHDGPRVSAWWQAWKRRLAYRLHEDLRALTGIELNRTTPADLITAVIQTCPIPSHPDTSIIEQTVESIREQLPDCEIIITCDGMRPSFADRQDDYDEHLLRLTRLCERWHNVVPVILDAWGHQTGGMRAALDLVTTPIMLPVEHDTPLTGEIPWAALCGVILREEVGMIRLNHETDIHPEHRAMLLDDIPEHVDTLDSESGSWHLSDEPRVRVQHYGPERVPLARTMQWCQRPHLALTSMYRDRILPLFGAAGRTYIEWVCHSAIQDTPPDNPDEDIEVTWARWKVAIYHPEGNIQRSLHLDGRAGASTEDSLVAYDEMKEAQRLEATAAADEPDAVDGE